MNTRKTIILVTVLILLSLAVWYVLGIGNSAPIPKKTTSIESKSSVSAPKNKKELQTKHLVASDEPVALESTAANTPEPLLHYYKSNELLGTPRAQLNLFLTLRRCDPSTMVSEESLEEMYLQGAEQSAIDRLRNDRISCEGLAEHLPNTNFEELAEAWLESAADEGDVIAKLLTLYQYPDPPLQEDVLPLIYQSFSVPDAPPALKSVVYDSVSRFHSDHILSISPEELATNGNRRGASADAWDYLSCKSSNRCDIEEYLDLYRRFDFHENEIEAMVERAEEFEKAIENKDWDALQLNDAAY